MAKKKDKKDKKRKEKKDKKDKLKSRAESVREKRSKKKLFIQDSSGHNFQYATFRNPEWCDLCDKFIWGLRKQGLCCKVCNYKIHKKCLKVADEISNCSSVIQKRQSSKKFNLKKSHKSFIELQEGLKFDIEKIPGHRIQLFVDLLKTLPEDIKASQDTYDCFDGKLVYDNTVFDILLELVKNEDTDRRNIGFTIFSILMQNDDNISVFVESNGASELLFICSESISTIAFSTYTHILEKVIDTVPDGKLSVPSDVVSNLMSDACTGNGTDEDLANDLLGFMGIIIALV
eukprot:TRINITY_DN964_c0_g1_i3.p1 TRINITY_DN964_c0_g1~~TRINITY_DN964_c0_g1_i3.p1  ORF type:complete len:289 (-),score=51.30 TRINITY_DN964_c0_g1_i3:31-897(-)